MRVSLETFFPSSRLLLDYVRRENRIRRFYPHHFGLDAIAGFARAHPGLAPDRRAALASALGAQQRRWSVDPGPVNRLAAGAVAVVTGQQAGLFTGPMYSVLKALTAVKLARQLDERGIPAVPVFWIAAEDHDQAEITRAGTLDGDSAFRVVTTDFADGAGTPAGWLHFRASILDAIRECFDGSPASGVQAEVRALVESAYRPDVSPVDAFARMMGRLFAGTGLIFVDRLDPALRSLSAEVLARSAERNGVIRSAVLERTREVEAAGYVPQVRVDPDFTGLFAFRGRVREAWRRDGTVAASDLSPNVLLRPVVQDALLPTAVYVAGPAEIAYFAQAGAVYDCMDQPMPPIFPRITATLIEPPVARIMKKYGLGVEGVLAGAAALKERILGSKPESEVFQDVRRRVVEEVERLRPVLGATDATLEGALDNALHKVTYQLDTLRLRFINAEAKRGEVLDRQIQTLVNRLSPHGKPQERMVSVLPFLGRYGLRLVTMLDERLELDGTVHQAVEL